MSSDNGYSLNGGSKSAKPLQPVDRVVMDAFAAAEGIQIHEEGYSDIVRMEAGESPQARTIDPYCGHYADGTDARSAYLGMVDRIAGYDRAAHRPDYHRFDGDIEREGGDWVATLQRVFGWRPSADHAPDEAERTMEVVLRFEEHSEPLKRVSAALDGEVEEPSENGVEEVRSLDRLPAGENPFRRRWYDASERATA